MLIWIFIGFQRNARMERHAAVRVRDLEKAEKKNAKWTRREETDFYRIISSFGVETTRRGSADETRQYIWDTFRQMANLHKKDDDMISDYMDAFCYMCRRVLNKLTPAEECMCYSSIPQYLVNMLLIKLQSLIVR